MYYAGSSVLVWGPSLEPSSALPVPSWMPSTEEDRLLNTLQNNRKSGWKA
jgi:hypothetical protein